MKILNTHEKIITSERIPPLSSFNIEHDDFPTAEFVVCKSRDGLIVSRYGDMEIWFGISLYIILMESQVA